VPRRIWLPGALFACALVVALVHAGGHLPAAADYRVGADEGVYYHQALTVRQEGLRGFARIADEYVRDPAAQIGPPPIRIGHIVTTAAALAVSPSIRTLSVVSLVCYALLCVVVFLAALRFWDSRVAALAGLFAAASPLGWGLATRALMDTDHALFSTLALFTLVWWLSTGRERHFVVFAIALTWCVLVKETAWMQVPFAVAAMVAAKIAGRETVRLRHVVVIGVAVPAAVALAYAAAFGGPARALAVIEVAHRANVAQPNSYLATYGAGPWYEYAVDFLVLSPLVTVLFLLFCGRTIAVPARDPATLIMLLFVCYAIAALAPLAKNLRFALPLDPLLRIGAAAMIAATAAALRAPAARAAVLTLLAAAVVVTDARAFQRFFVEGRIYDPVAVNLLSVAGSIPPARSDVLAVTPSAQLYLNLSLQQYQARDFHAAIRTARQAIALAPDSAEAYNNLGAAHAELGEWQSAVDALETALRLRPDFPLARNNLAWARAELAKR